MMVCTYSYLPGISKQRRTYRQAGRAKPLTRSSLGCLVERQAVHKAPSPAWQPQAAGKSPTR